MSKLASKQSRTSEPRTEKTDTVAEASGRAALRPEINTLLVIDAFKDSYLGEDINLGRVLGHLEKSIQDVKSGDLTHLESMLLGQATTLQALFTCFAIKAANQKQLPNYQTFMSMAFKAQAQSRATLQTLVELKNPRQPTFVKQANIAHGPQQVNNGSAPAPTVSHAEKPANRKNKLLEPNHVQEHRVVTGAKSTPSRADPAMATLDGFHRAQEPRR